MTPLPASLTTNLFASAALSLTLGAAVLVISMPAHAQESAYEDLPLDTKLYRSMMENLGLKRDGEAINYQERAPLVIPPARDLPPPEKSDGVIAKNPAWPKDPDAKRRKAEATVGLNRNISDDREREQNPLREDQLTPGPGAKKQPGRSDGYQASPNGYSNPSPPSGKSIFSKIFSKDDDEQVGKFTGEPPRTSLTAPPRGYQTPSPDQPYGVGKAAPAKPKDYLTTHGEGEGSR